MFVERASNHLFEDGELEPREKAHFWIDGRFRDLECFHARFHEYRYSPHFHDTYVFGHVERGVELCRSRGRDFVLTPGSLTIINPGDLHDGRPGEQGFEYRMLYPSVGLMCQAAREAGLPGGEVPRFSNSHIKDRELSARFGMLHRLLETGGEGLLAEGMMLEMLALLVRRHADQPLPEIRVGREDRRIARVRDYIAENLDAEMGLQELADLAGMNRYRLIRAFRKEMGLTPHAYVLNRRVQRAKCLLKTGLPLAEAGMQSGFYDQPHFSRVFKKSVGVTPGAYARACHG